MENLPDELWLLIFRYLHKIDILYSFNNLNRRIQQMIISYADQINLIHASSKIFRTFCQYVFHHQIHSLVVDIRSDQLQLPKRCFLSLAKSLKSLTFIDNNINDETRMDENIDFYLDELHRFKQLTDLHIYGNYSLSGRLAKSAKYAPSTLINLSLICSVFWSMGDTEVISYVHLTPIRLRNLIALTISSTHEKYLSYLSTKSVNLNREELWNIIVINDLMKLRGSNISICPTSTTIAFDGRTDNHMLNSVFDNLYRILPAIHVEKYGPQIRQYLYYKDYLIIPWWAGGDKKKRIIHRHLTTQYRYAAYIFRKERRSCNIGPISMLLQLRDDVLYIPRSRRSNGAVIKLLNNSNNRYLKRRKNYATNRSTTYYFQNSFYIIDLSQIVGHFFDDITRIPSS